MTTVSNFMNEGLPSGDRPINSDDLPGGLILSGIIAAENNRDYKVNWITQDILDRTRTNPEWTNHIGWADYFADDDGSSAARFIMSVSMSDLINIGSEPTIDILQNSDWGEKELYTQAILSLMSEYGTSELNFEYDYSLSVWTLHYNLFGEKITIDMNEDAKLFWRGASQIVFIEKLWYSHQASYWEDSSDSDYFCMFDRFVLAGFDNKRYIPYGISDDDIPSALFGDFPYALVLDHQPQNILDRIRENPNWIKRIDWADFYESDSPRFVMKLGFEELTQCSLTEYLQANGKGNPLLLGIGEMPQQLVNIMWVHDFSKVYLVFDYDSRKWLVSIDSNGAHAMYDVIPTEFIELLFLEKLWLTHDASRLGEDDSDFT